MLIVTLLSSDPHHSLLQDIASPKFSMPSPVRTVIVADFDNDQELEVFFNNIAYRNSAANRLFRYHIRAMGATPKVREAVPEGGWSWIKRERGGEDRNQARSRESSELDISPCCGWKMSREDMVQIGPYLHPHEVELPQPQKCFQSQVCLGKPGLNKEGLACLPETSEHL